MRVTGAGDPRQSIKDTLKLPQRTLTTGAAKGYSSYGNQIGLATGEVKEYYHQGFIAKRHGNRCCSGGGSGPTLGSGKNRFPET